MTRSSQSSIIQKWQTNQEKEENNINMNLQEIAPWYDSTRTNEIWLVWNVASRKF